jgi:signal transduction histidine kinase
MYLLLSGFVRGAGLTIHRQQAELSQKVNQLTDLLTQNDELHRRVRRAAASVALLNESFLRRIGSELHDGPAQELSLSVLKLDALIGRVETQKTLTVDDPLVENLAGVETSLQGALKEMRGIAAGLSVPQLADLSLPETIQRAVRAHERRTGTSVEMHLAPIPEEAPLPLKITVFRVLQEGLTNAFRHALGLGQQVAVSLERNLLIIEISDKGPGFNPEKVASWEGHLGLNGMRERVESLSGSFTIETAPGQGTRLIARLPCEG